MRIGIAFGYHRFPDGFPGALVEGDHRCLLSTRRADQSISIDEWIVRPPERLRPTPEIFPVVLFPQDAAGVTIETEKDRVGGESVEAIPVNNGLTLVEELHEDFLACRSQRGRP